MSTFRCAAGHQTALIFGAEQVRLPCPACGIDVYKFRDAMLADTGPTPALGAADAAAAPRKLTSLVRRPRQMAIGALILLAGVAALIATHSGSAPLAPSRAPILPTVTVAKPPPPDRQNVSITDFHATAVDGVTVRLSFHLNNRGSAATDYPGLAIRWHDVTGADQRIRRDGYVHPPLPFTAADVMLELDRPQGATGIDVSIIY